MALSPQSESWCLTVSKLVLFGEGETLPWGRNSWGRASGTHRSSGKERLFPQALDLRLWVGWRPPDAVMQSESSRCEEEPPSLLWGLDPVFLAFAKLYIRDILDLKESRQVPVDDSTGVINCICWKKLNNTDSSSATAATNARELSLTSQLKKLQETIAQRLKIEIGDLVQIRGHIRTYREEREIHATVYHKVDDPVCNIQIARMLELPTIYRKVYDQPFHHPALEKEEALSNPGALDLNSLTCLLSEKAKEFLVENRVQSFYQQELETVESLLSLAKQPVVHSTRPGQVDFKNDTTSKAIHSIFKNAIKLLQEKGFVFQKDRGFDNLFYVTREDKELHRKILQIIQEDCQKPNRKWCTVHVTQCPRRGCSLLESPGQRGRRPGAFPKTAWKHAGQGCCPLSEPQFPLLQSEC
uniref:CST complex subunit STN1 n=1 Tax=Sus scrofa TaxID=9823 RepID=A0A8D1KXB1_PIG